MKIRSVERLGKGGLGLGGRANHEDRPGCQASLAAPLRLGNFLVPISGHSARNEEHEEDSIEIRRSFFAFLVCVSPFQRIHPIQLMPLPRSVSQLNVR